MESIRIFVVCSVGAFVGSVIALQMHQMFWWVGAAVGAFVAYLGYNIEEVIAAIPVAYRRTISWRPNHEFWPLWRHAFMFMFNLGVNAAVGFGLVAAFSYAFWEVHSPANYRLLVQLEWIIFLSSIGTGSVLGLTIACTARASYPMTNPNVFRLYLWMLPRGIVFGLWWLITHSPNGARKAMGFVSSVAKLAKTFVVEFFCLIHSELRLLCAVDVALGTAVGYFFGNPLVGGVAGGVLGVVNYEIFTVRVMKLAGAKSLFN